MSHCIYIVTLPLLLVIASCGGEQDCSLDNVFGPDPIPRPCIASSCWNCDNVDANCELNETASTLNCVANLTQCNLTECEECSYCSATFGRPATESGDGWRITSLCLNLGNLRCEDDSIGPQCVENAPIPFTDVSEVTMPDTFYTCSCFADDCVERATIFYTLSSPSPSTTLQGQDGGSSVATGWIIAIAVIGTIVMIGVAVILGIGAFYIKGRLDSIPKRLLPRPPFERTNEHPLPFNLIQPVISRGRYGYVYQAEYRGKKVAVKIVNSRHSWENERNLYTMESTTHRNILEYVASESRGSGYQLQLFMVTKYYPLGSLNQFLRRHVVSWEQACTMIESIASGLAHLHSETYTNSSGIVAEKYPIAHRDVKSANVLVRDEGGECVLGDLGLALILDPSADTKQLANAGQVGTFRYMAPEALDAVVHLQDPQSFKHIDVYAMALVMWEVLWRCTAQGEDSVPEYQAPFGEVVGERPTLEMMKDIVVTRRLRPTLPSSWMNHQGMMMLVETIEECWDGDPEARLSAANVFLRMEEIHNLNETSSNTSEPNTSPANIQTTPNCPFDEQPPAYSRPPPYFSHNGGTGGSNKPYFQTSMPHIIFAGETYTNLIGPRATRSLHNIGHQDESSACSHDRQQSLTENSITLRTDNPHTSDGLMSSSRTTSLDHIFPVSREPPQI